MDYSIGESVLLMLIDVQSILLPVNSKETKHYILHVDF